MTNHGQIYAFLAGLQAFHALVHGYLSVTKIDIDHPVERLGVNVTPRFHAVAAGVNAAIALGLGAAAIRSRRARTPAA